MFTNLMFNLVFSPILFSISLMTFFFNIAIFFMFALFFLQRSVLTFSAIAVYDELNLHFVKVTMRLKLYPKH